jgi:hypothetical protein
MKLVKPGRGWSLPHRSTAVTFTAVEYLRGTGSSPHHGAANPMRNVAVALDHLIVPIFGDQ